MWYINVISIKFIKLTTYEILLILKFGTGFSFMRHLIHEISCDTYFDIIVERMSEVRKGTPRNTKNENERHKIFNMVLHMNWDYVSGKKR
jgi:hypothetical protein